MQFEFDNKTTIECEGCGARVAVLHDHELITFCPVCGEDVQGETDEWILQHIENE